MLLRMGYLNLWCAHRYVIGSRLIMQLQEILPAEVREVHQYMSRYDALKRCISRVLQSDIEKPVIN